MLFLLSDFSPLDYYYNYELCSHCLVTSYVLKLLLVCFMYIASFRSDDGF